jgi:hypothetical protein
MDTTLNWLAYYQNNYYDLLMPKSSGAKRGLVEGHLQRGTGFLKIFERLLLRRTTNFYIVETGTLRNPGNWKDGQSAKIFTEFVDRHGGWVKSVDIDTKAVQAAQRTIHSERFQVFCSDSVDWLKSQTNLHAVDLFYLDSWDCKWENDQPSAEHHLREFQAIKAGAMVAIDDNSRFVADYRRTGKGRLIVEYLEQKGRQPIHDAYQIIYQF